MAHSDGSRTEAAAHVGRRYGGVPAAERQAERRERLIRAAIALYGAQGYRRTTVTDVCRSAGLTPRYFYESFENSEALLLESFREVAAYVATRVADAADAAGGTPDQRLSALLTAYYGLLRDDAGTARVFLSELSGIDARVDALFARSTATFADLIARVLDPAHVGGTTDPLARAGAMHGMIAVARNWIARDFAEPITVVVATVQPLCRMLVARAD